MKNASKKNGFTILSLFFGLALLAQVGSGFSVPETEDLTCQPPSVYVTGKSEGTVSYAWSAVSGSLGYRVYYTRQEDNYTSGFVNTGNTNITFTDLPAGTYDFHFATLCIEGPSSYTIDDDLVMF